MNKTANVIYAYSPKNDDELELAVGDKIEIIGVEEEGWWKGVLKGQVGVFPSNFVEVIESGQQTGISQAQNVASKLNSKLSSKILSKNSLSSNSINNISNSNNNLNNNNKSINNNLIMNNTQQHDTDSSSEYPFQSADDSLHSSSSSERRPRPIRGVGYGDIFAAGAKTKLLPADPKVKPTVMASERLSTTSSNLASTLQKPIPKKPPPPAPTSANDTNTNGSSTDQAPALPPKPSNQFHSYLQQQQQQQHSIPMNHPVHPQPNQQRAVREQARVIFAYKPTNDDELAIEVGDYIDVIDKNIEDAGWWKGELRGKIGVFPDNFVQLINAQESPNVDWQSARSHNATQQSTIGSNQQHQVTSGESKVKSVFATTPKGFSKELESNIEKHNNPGSFLSLKRNRPQQMSAAPSIDSTMTMMATETSDKMDVTHSLIETTTTKLNHITANRAKGPQRRPPSNILNKRNQSLAENNNNKPESNGREDPSLASLPISSLQQSNIVHDSLSSLPVGQQQPVSTFASVSGPSNPASAINQVLQQDQQQPQATQDLSPPAGPNNSNQGSMAENQISVPKTNQRTNQSASANQQPEKAKVTPPASTTSRPPWLVELRKSNLGRKRDPGSGNQEDEQPTSPTVSKVSELQASVDSISLSSSPEHATSTKPSTDLPRKGAVGANHISPIQMQESLNNMDSSPVLSRLNYILNSNRANSQPESMNWRGEFSPPVRTSNENGVMASVSKLIGPQTNPIASTTESDTPVSADLARQTSTVETNKMSSIVHDGQQQQLIVSDEAEFTLPKAHYDSLVRQISKSVANEISELREQVRKLQEDASGLGELRANFEEMKVELKICQSATENQKRYIKELVNNLADERKKIAAMQSEIDGTLK